MNLGPVSASLRPDVRATAATRKPALAALESAIEKRLDRGELVALEVRRRGLAGLFGKYRDDPTLRQIREEAYHERDADVPTCRSERQAPWSKSGASLWLSSTVTLRLTFNAGQ